MNATVQVKNFLCICRRYFFFALIFFLIVCFKEPVFAGYSKSYPLPNLTGNYKNDIISVAKSQLGYKESNTGETIYSAWAKQPGRPWCSEFVAWCANKAKIPASVIPVGTSSNSYRKFYSGQKRFYILNNGKNNRSCGCASKSSKTIHISDIRPGDILLIETNGNYSDGPDHTCLAVSYAKGGVVTAIDGNYRDQVMFSSRSADKIHGVCRPLYQLSKVSLSAKRLSKTQVRLSWKKISNISGYRIYRSTKKNSGYKLIKTVSSKTTSYKVKNLTKNKKYYYKIAAYYKCNGKIIRGAFSNIRRI